MITIVSKPQDLNYSLSLPRIKYRSDKSKVTATLFQGTTEILKENYIPFNATTDLELKYDFLIDGLLSNEFPKTEETTVHAHAFDTYKVILTDSDGSKEINFKVVKGYYYAQPLDLGMLFSTSWLNVAANRRFVRENQPLFLTVFAQAKINVKIQCVFTDATTAILPFGIVSSGTFQTLNISPYLIQQLNTKTVSEFTVYGTNDLGEINTGKRAFVIEHFNAYSDDYFVFKNRLGGWESLTLTGQKTNSFKNTPSTAQFDDKVLKYANDLNRIVKKNTGYLNGHDQQTLLIEMISSTQQYHILDGAPREINFKDPTVDLIAGSLNDIDLEFTYSDPMMAHPRIEQLPNYLKIS